MDPDRKPGKSQEDEVDIYEEFDRKLLQRLGEEPE